MVRRGVLTATLVAVLLQDAACEGCADRAPPPTTEPPPSSIVDVDGPRDGEGERKGMGWYPNVEVDGASRLHLAWVDADAGDVRYAVTVPGGSALEGGIVTVDATGAVGSFLRLALLPGGAPVLSYARQDTQIFRFAWRPDDRAVMKGAGADVDSGPFPALPTSTTTGGPVALLGGFIGEEVGFGDQVGRGSALGVDKAGRIALPYYSADDRLRLARRPADVAAFAADSIGVLEKRDLDGFARSSVRVVADVAVLDDGTVVVAYAHDVVTDARLRVAVLPPGATRATVIEDNRGATVTLDGLQARLFPTVADGRVVVDVVAHDKTARAVVRRRVDVATAAFLPDRERLVEVDGITVACRRDGGWYVLARVGGDGGGVYLYVVDVTGGVDGAAASEVRRIRLGGGGRQLDAWLDVAVRPDGRPAAVWFDAEAKSLRLYAP